MFALDSVTMASRCTSEMAISFLNIKVCELNVWSGSRHEQEVSQHQIYRDEYY